MERRMHGVLRGSDFSRGPLQLRAAASSCASRGLLGATCAWCASRGRFSTQASCAWRDCSLHGGLKRAVNAARSGVHAGTETCYYTWRDGSVVCMEGWKRGVKRVVRYVHEASEARCVHGVRRGMEPLVRARAGVAGSPSSRVQGSPSSRVQGSVLQALLRCVCGQTACGQKRCLPCSLTTLKSVRRTSFCTCVVHPSVRRTRKACILLHLCPAERTHTCCICFYVSLSLRNDASVSRSCSPPSK